MGFWRFLVTVISLLTISYFLLSSILVGDRKQSPETIEHQVLQDQGGHLVIAVPGKRFSKLALYQLAQQQCRDRSPCRLDILRHLPQLEEVLTDEEPPAEPQRERIARFVKTDPEDLGQFTICTEGDCGGDSDQP